MPTREELYTALRNADKAGDTEGARKLAAYIQSMPAAAAPAAPAPQPREATAGDRASAIATGMNRGAFTRLAGMPVDTIMNVVDLAKAGLGTITNAAGRPDWSPIIPDNRKDIAGSGDWTEERVRQMGGGGLIDPTGPNDATARVLHGTGMGIGGAIAGGRMSGVPMSNLAMARNAFVGGAGGLAGGVATENGAPPSVAILASMAPQAIGATVAGGVKLATRGGEAGRQTMAQRIQDFKNAGVENPSVGLAGGRPTIQGIENLLANTPGGVGPFQRSKNALMDGMQAKAGEVRDLASTAYGADVAGRAIQADLKNLLKSRVTDSYERANDKMVNMIPSGERFPITNSLNALADVTSVNPMAPNTTAGFVQPRIAGLRQNMLADTARVVPGAGPSMFTDVNIGLPVSATRAIRSSIGKEAASSAIMGTPEQADFKRVYAGLSDDIRGAARATDAAAGPQPNNVGPAERSFNRGNALFSAGMDRIDRVQPFANKAAPEQAYNALIQSGKENVSTLRAVKKSVGDDARASTAATWIDRLGRATPGAQNELSDKFSTDRLLTNWNTMTPKARAELLSGFKGSEQVASSMDDIAKAASMLKDSSKIWANPSGTSGNISAKGILGGVTVGAIINPALGASMAGGVASANAAARLMTNQKFVKWLAESTHLPSSQEAAQLTRLSTMANASNDEAFKRDVEEYRRTIESKGGRQ